MILVDTSAWVEYLRATRSKADRRLTRLLEERAPLATTDALLMEVLAGARDTAHRDQLRRLLAGCTFLGTEGPGDWERAADVYRICRAAGDTVRALTDCLIAVVAMRAEIPVLHVDSDFEVIARHTELTVA